MFIKLSSGSYNMRLLKILIILIFIASLTNVNVCGKTVLKKENQDTRNKPFITTGYENSDTAIIFSRQEQTGKKITELTGLSKIFLVFSAGTSNQHISNCQSLHFAPGKLHKYSLLSLNCLLTI